MSHLDKELENLKDSIMEMWKLCIKQLSKSKQAIIEFDKDLAHEVMANEKRVNGFELKIDRDCEDIFALFNPLAVDLRFVLAVLKINSNLERIGDIADSIARYVLEADQPFNPEEIKRTRMMEMFDIGINMLETLLEAANTEDTRLARSVFKQDEIVDSINSEAPLNVVACIQDNPGKTKECLQVLSIIRKLERLGDQSKNIAEEIIFYVEAKVLKHASKKDKKNKEKA